MHKFIQSIIQNLHNLMNKVDWLKIFKDILYLKAQVAIVMDKNLLFARN